MTLVDIETEDLKTAISALRYTSGIFLNTESTTDDNWAQEEGQERLEKANRLQEALNKVADEAE